MIYTILLIAFLVTIILALAFVLIITYLPPKDREEIENVEWHDSDHKPTI